MVRIGCAFKRESDFFQQFSNSKILICSLISILLLSLLMVPTTNVIADTVDTDDNWSMFQHDEYHSGFTSSSGPNTNEILWQYSTNSAIGLSSPVVVNGMLYIGLQNMKVLCLNSIAGTVVWETETDSWMSATVAVAYDRVYAASGAGTVYCFDASDGAILWNVSLGSQLESHPVVVDDKVYIGSEGIYGGKLYCLDAFSGDTLWSYVVGSVENSAVVTADKVYVCSQYSTGSLSEGRIYCLDAETGGFLWNYSLSEYTVYRSSPTYVAKKSTGYNKLIVGATGATGGSGGRIYCFNADTGGVLWTFAVSAPIYSSPAVGYDQVYAGCHNGLVYCLAVDTGKEIWNFTANGLVSSSPAVADNKVYFSSGAGMTYCVDVFSGDLLWNYTLSSSGYPSPAVADGRLYVAELNGMIHCFEDEESTPDQLVISIKNLVVSERNSFIVTVLSNGDPVSDVRVSFAGVSKTTNALGTITLTAPEVNADEEFTLSVTKTGYLPDSVTIKVENSEDELTLEMDIPGYVYEEDVFQVSVTANNLPVENVQIGFNQELYQTDTNGQITLTAPSVSQDTEFIITASKTGYINAQDTLTVRKSPDGTSLELIVPGSVSEGNTFQVSVTSDGYAVEYVIVTFQGKNYLTDDNGRLTIHAPEVIHDTSFKITALKTGYTSDEKWITIKNVNGLVKGTVTDTNNQPIKNVVVCVYLSAVTTLCELSDSMGYYELSVPAGSYTMKVRKDGYASVVEESIPVSDSDYTNQDFMLSASADKQTNSLVDYTISNAINSGQVSATVDVTSKENVGVSLFDDTVDVSLETSDLAGEQGVSLTVSGNRSNETKIVVYLGVVDDTDDLMVYYDGVRISQATDIATFFDVGNVDEEWILTTAEQNGDKHAIVIVNIPHFSTHSIQIIGPTPPQLAMAAILALAVLAVATVGMFTPRKE